MKKILLSILIVLMLAFPSFATTYYAQSGSANMSAIEWDTASGGGGTDLVWAERLAGDVFVANGNTGIVVDTDPGVGGSQVTLSTATNGGGFTLTTVGTPATITAHMAAGTTPCLVISGAVNATTTILGNCTGGSVAASYGLHDTHTVGTVVVGSVGSPTTLTGGTTTGTTSHGYYYAPSGAGTATVYGNAVATAYGIGFAHNGSSSTASITGNCTGSDAANVAGCSSTAAGPMTITGNIINGDRAVGAVGTIRWTPTAPSDGVTGHYVKFDGGGTAVYAGTNTDDATKALSTFYYIDPTDGSSDVGTAGGGGGAWGF
jgi:hypothetical protein